MHITATLSIDSRLQGTTLHTSSGPVNFLRTDKAFWSARDSSLMRTHQSYCGPKGTIFPFRQIFEIAATRLCLSLPIKKPRNPNTGVALFAFSAEQIKTSFPRCNLSQISHLHLSFTATNDIGKLSLRVRPLADKIPFAETKVACESMTLKFQAAQPRAQSSPQRLPAPPPSTAGSLQNVTQVTFLPFVPTEPQQPRSELSQDIAFAQASSQHPVGPSLAFQPPHGASNFTALSPLPPSTAFPFAFNSTSIPLPSVPIAPTSTPKTVQMPAKTTSSQQPPLSRRRRPSYNAPYRPYPSPDSSSNSKDDSKLLTVAALLQLSQAPQPNLTPSPSTGGISEEQIQ